MNNPYNILNIKPEASLNEIKSSYRSLVKKYHPDKSLGGKSAKVKYDQIRQAYEILSDTKSKKSYDLGLIDGSGKKIIRPSIKPNFKYNPSTNNSQKKDFFSFLKNDISNKGNVNNAFKYQSGKINNNINYHLTLSEVEAKKGCAKVICLNNNKKLKVNIPANSVSNDKLRIKNVAIDNVFDKKNRVEVIIHLEVINKQLKPYKTLGKDIYIKFPISVYEAINGAKINLDTLGGAVVVSIDKLTSSNTILRIKGKGIQAKAGELNGDLYLDIKIVMPKSLPKELTSQLKKYPDYGHLLRK